MNSPPTPATGLPRALVLQFRRFNMSMLGVYGNEWSWTRTFDRLATRGVVFDQHFAATTDEKLAHDVWHICEPEFIRRLNRAGVCTVRVRMETDPSPPEGWVIDEPAPIDPKPESLRELRQCVYNALDQVPATAPALLWIELDPFVAPWRPTNEWLKFYFDTEDDEETIEPWFDHLPPTIEDDDSVLERLQTTYAAILSSVDQNLTKLLAGCRSRGFGKNGLTIISADLGEPLGENGLIGRSTDKIGEGLVHLPLILRLPGNAHACRRFSHLTQPADIGATLLNHLGVEQTGPGVSLLSYFAGQPRHRDHVTIRGHNEVAIRTIDHLLIAPTPNDVETARLFLKPEDRWEFNDLAKKQEGEVERLLSLL